MANIAILGSGRVASVLAQGLCAAKHKIQIGRHTDDTTRPEWATNDIEVTTTRAAILSADVVFNATPGETSVAFLTEHKDAMKGKILVDVSNGVRRNEKGMPCGLAYPESSVAEQLQLALPETSVVKTLNTMLFVIMAKPAMLGTPASVFLSGDNVAAKATTRAILRDLGWPEAAIEDLGGIATARGPESFMHFVPPLMTRDGMVPFALAIAR